jgi:tRNA A37 threonylcarbamoyladenosine modification protein TsaB
MKLFLDSSTSYFACGLFDNNDDLIFSRICSTSFEKDDWLYNEWQTIKKQLSATKIDLHLGLGPGSFTGVRVLAAFVRSLSSFYDFHFYTFNSIDFWSHNLDTFTHDVYLQRFNAHSFYAKNKNEGAAVENIPVKELADFLNNYSSVFIWYDSYLRNSASKTTVPLEPDNRKSFVEFHMKDSGFQFHSDLLFQFLNNNSQEITGIDDIIEVYGHELTFKSGLTI